MKISRVFAFRSARRADDGRAAALDVARETGWRLDVSRANSGYLKRSGGRLRLIGSTVDLCRRPGGAHVLFRWHDRVEKEANATRTRIGARLFRHERANVGTTSMIYLGGPPDYSVRVLWVQGRVLASVWTSNVGRKAAMELARIQERRIATALG